MVSIIIGFLLIIAAVIVYTQSKQTSASDNNYHQGAVRYLKHPIAMKSFAAVLGFFGTLSLASTSYVHVPENNIGLLERIYFAKNLPEGRVMMYDGESIYKGPQPNYLTSGFHFVPFINFLYDVHFEPVTEVQQGTYLKLVSLDGKALPNGDFMAPAWTIDSDEMLKPEVFLKNNGYKGSQLTVLPPGKYPVNRKFWRTEVGKVTQVDTGEVAVVRSSVQTDPTAKCDDIKYLGSPGESTASTLVPKGCKGVWITPLTSGTYYLHDLAYSVTHQSTRVQVWNYKGGYTRREINLTVNEDGGIDQEEKSSPVDSKDSYADNAVLVRTKDGWTVPIEVRVPYQVYAENAARVVAGVGDLKSIEDRIITPIVNDVARQIAGATEASKLYEARSSIVDAIEQAVVKEASKAGVSIVEVRLDEIVLPPELLLPQRRTQLASSLSSTYAQEKLANENRAKSEEAKERANKQNIVVEADMQATAAKRRGEGARDEMIAIAEGQRAQRDVIGAEQAVMLQMLKDILAVAKENPDIIKVPLMNVNSAGGSGDLEGAAAILGGVSNLATMMEHAKKGKSEPRRPAQSPAN